MQQLEYTPGGTIWRSFDQNALQPKHFCDKEQLTVHGYNMYDSGKRFHTSNGIRFISMDPLAEKYYSWSPYAYYMGNPMNAIDPDGRQGIPLPIPVPLLPIYYNPPASKISDQDLANAINKSVDNTINTLKNGLILSAATAYVVFEKTKQTITPEYQHQKNRDKRNKEELDLNQANIAKSIDANITGNMPNGDPAPKRGPQGIGKSVLIIGEAAAIIEDWNKNVLNSQSQSNIPQKDNFNETVNKKTPEQETGKDNIILTPITNSLNEIFNKQW